MSWLAADPVIVLLGNTRTEQDFARFLDNLLSSAAANTRWDIVCDNLNIHLSESVVPTSAMKKSSTRLRLMF
jgi:hypothetical protein